MALLEKQSVPYPPEEPLFHIPLYELVVQEDIPAGEVPETPETPEARVDVYLNDHGDLFAAVNEAWGFVGASQQHIKDLNAQLFGGGEGSAGLNRDTRRLLASVTRAAQDARITFGGSRQGAASTYEDMAKDIDFADPVIATNEPISKDLLELWTGREKWEVKDQDKDKHLKDKRPSSTAKMINEYVQHYLDSQTVLIGAYAFAFFRNDLALRSVRAFLSDEAVVPAFLQRVTELARENDSSAYPGLLETLATHTEQAGQSNMLRESIQKTAPPVEAHAPTLLEDMESGREQLPKELSAAIGVMKIAARIIESETALDHNDFMRLFAAQAANWPSELRAKLQTFANARTVEQWNVLKESLAPYVRPGRVVTATVERTINARQTNTGRRKPEVGKPGAQDKQLMHTRIRMAGGSAADIEALFADDFEKNPVSHFAVFERRPGHRGQLVSIESVESLEELFDLSNLSEYIKKYQSSDPTVEPMIKAALNHILRYPTDTRYTKRMGGMHYMKDGDPHKIRRSPLRFSPQHFPGISKGPTATETRLIYDVTRHAGASTLVMHGAFLKKELNYATGNTVLPRIR